MTSVIVSIKEPPALAGLAVKPPAVLEKGFLYRSLAADMYFVNVRFMFNGDRMALVHSYRRKGSMASVQPELPLDEPLTIEHAKSHAHALRPAPEDAE
jgi:hypothetical protein